MTVYVDDYRYEARVGRIDGIWSHLTADTPTELHEFAARIGMRRRWFQGHCKSSSCPSLAGVCVHFHYDVVEARRREAIAAGAKPVGIRDLAEIIRQRRQALREMQ